MDSGYINLPGGNRIPPHIARRVCGGMANDFTSLKYRQWVGPIQTNLRGFVFSDAVPEGLFWWVTALSGMNSDSTVRTIAFHLVPRQFPADSTFFSGALEAGPTQASVRIDAGGGGSQNYTSSGNVKVPFAVPSGFRLLAYEDVNAAGAGTYAFTMRAAFFEVSNGQLAPGMC